MDAVMTLSREQWKQKGREQADSSMAGADKGFQI